MPIKRCTLPDGTQGYKYGDSGKCYKSKDDALEQMRAIKYSETHSDIANRTFDRLDKRIKEEKQCKE